MVLGFGPPHPRRLERHRFLDFVRAGVPFVLIVLIVSVLLIALDFVTLISRSLAIGSWVNRSWTSATSVMLFLRSHGRHFLGARSSMTRLSQPG